MVCGFHRFEKTPNSVGGAPIGYEQLVQLLLEQKHTLARPHDLHEVIEDFTQGRKIEKDFPNGSTIVCTVGPYAHLYMIIRELTGIPFRVVRDVRTTCWAPYLFQETICKALERSDDIRVLPSNYTEKFLEAVLPMKRTLSKTLISYPISDSLQRGRNSPEKSSYRIGYLGRISDDKNIRSFLKVGALAQKERHDVELHIAGPFYPKSKGISTQIELMNTARATGVNVNSMKFHDAIGYEKIGEFLQSMDTMFFPSTSSNETFGRVLVESQAIGTPIVSANFAAAHELVCGANLVPVKLNLPNWIASHPPFRFGEPDVELAVERVLDPRRKKTSLKRNDPRFYLEAIFGDGCQNENIKLNPEVSGFLDRLEVSGLVQMTYSDALELGKTLLEDFAFYHRSEEMPLPSEPNHMNSEGQSIYQALMTERARVPEQRWALRNALIYTLRSGFIPKFRISGN